MIKFGAAMYSSEAKLRALNHSLRSGSGHKPNDILKNGAAINPSEASGLWSGRKDLNLRPYGPEPYALAN
jgi:hypothetical protein